MTLNIAGISLPAPTWNAKRPVRIALLGDFGGGAGQGRLDSGDALARRKPMKVEFDTLEDAMARLSLSLTLPLGADGAPVEVPIGDLDAFHPDQIYREVSLFSELAALRKRLNNASTFAAAAKEVQSWGGEALARASTLARRSTARGATLARGATMDDFARLTGRASTAAQAAGSVDRLLQRVVGPFVVPAADPKKDALVAAVDAALTDAMRAVLHHPDFQTAEALWRGVDFLLRRVETSHQLQVHLFDLSAEEFAADLSGVDDLADSALYRLLVGTPSQDADGGYAFVGACYQFDATPPHAELLGRAAQVAAHAGAPIVTAMATDPFADRREPPHKLVREAFAALREMPNASFLALVGPRFLLRHPYGKKSDPISSFAFEEFSREAGLRGMLWGHPALLALALLAQPGGSLVVDDLPFHYVVDGDGDSVALPCTDRLIGTDVASLLRDQGINAVMAHKGEAMVRLAGLEAVNGDGLALQNAPKRKAADTRFAVQSKIDQSGAQVSATFGPAVRKAGVAAAPLAGAAAAASADAADAENAAASDAEAQSSADDAAGAGAIEQTVEQAIDETSGVSDEVTSGDAAASADDELAALLASLDEPAPDAAAPETEAETSIDDELDALLKSLG
jgi:type VI secretion system protein ImpC